MSDPENMTSVEAFKAAVDPTCDLSIQHCVEHGNEVRFGGLPSMPWHPCR
jgi:hypothetical protein